MKAVLAGNFREYEFWLREGDNYLLESFYVADTFRLDGRVFDELILYGTYYRRSDARLIRDKAAVLLLLYRRADADIASVSPQTEQRYRAQRRQSTPKGDRAKRQYKNK